LSIFFHAIADILTTDGLMYEGLGMSRITAIDSLSIFHLFASEFIRDDKFIFFLPTSVKK